MPRRVSRLLCAVVLLAACASDGARDAPAPPPATAPTPVAALLAGEMALARGDLPAARTAYLALAAAADDPASLARAVEVIAASGDSAPARLPLARWLALEPRSAAALRWQLTLALAARDAPVAEDAAARLYAVAGAEPVIAAARAARPVQRGLQAVGPLATLHADDPALAYGLADIAERAARLTLAADHARRALALRPDWDQALVLAARIAVRGGSGRAALAPLERAQAANPRSAALAVQTASLLAEIGEPQAARAVLDGLLTRIPGDLDVRYARALLLAQGLDAALAAREFRALADQGVRPDEVPYWLGVIAEQAGDELAALGHYQRVGDSGPLAAAVLRAARILTRREGLALGRALIAQVRAAQPALAVDLSAGEAGLLAEQGDIAAARALLDAALAGRPDAEGLRRQAAELAARDGDLARAEALLRELLAERPDDPALQNALGYTLADAGQRLPEARALLDAALAAAPDDAAILDSAGWVRFRQADYTGARPLLERAWALARDAEIGAHLGELLWQQGERAAAREVWAAAAAVAADHPVLRATRARLDP